MSVKANPIIKHERLNALWHELRDKKPAEWKSVLARFARKYKLSERQAYRYLQQVRQLDTAPEVPANYQSPKQVLSVRLSNNMLERLKATSEVIGQPMSVIIEQALDSKLREIAQGIIDQADEELKALIEKGVVIPV